MTPSRLGRRSGPAPDVPAALLAVLRAAYDREDGAAGQLLRLDATEFAAAAEAHGVTGPVLRALAGRPDVSAHVVERLRDLQRRHVRDHLRALVDLEACSVALDAAGIPWVVLKGPVLAEAVHARPGERAYHDLDLLVSPDDLETAVQVLAEAGMPLVDVNWRLLRTELQGELHLVAPAGTPIDLHWHLVNDARARARTTVDTDRLLARRTWLDLGSFSVPSLEACDLLLHLALHAGTSGSDRLASLVDVDQCVRWAGPDWELVLARSREWGTSTVTGVVLERSRRCLSTPVPSDVLRRLQPRTWRSLGRAVDALSPVERSDGHSSLARAWARASAPSTAASARDLLRRLVAHLAEPDRGERLDVRRVAAASSPRSLAYAAGSEADRAAYFSAVRAGRAALRQG